MPKILLIGSDSYQVFEVIRAMKINHIIKEFNNKDYITQLKIDINQPNMFSPQLFILNNLLEYLTNQDIQQIGNSSSDVISIEKEVDQKLILSKIINQSLWQIKYIKPLEGNTLINWIKNRAIREDLLISNKIIQKLVGLHYNNLFMIENELIQLKHLYYLNKLPIEIPESINLGEQSIEGNIYDFTNAIGFRDQENIIQSFSKLMIEDLWDVFYLLLGCIRNLMRVSVKDIDGLHPYLVNLLTKQIKEWSIKELIDALNKLNEIEFKVKTSSGELKPLILQWIDLQVLRDVF